MTERSTSFGTDAARYDRARPGYPPELLDDLLAGGVRRVLDVGCGTGKVAAPLAARGCEVLGVEPDERMAEVARAHGVDVEVSTLEEWQPRGRSFDLVVAGQAWHWVDAPRALRVVAAALPPGRRLAVFWNRPEHDDATRAALDAAYAAAAPELAGAAIVLGNENRIRDLEHLDAIAASGFFEPTEVWTYGHVERYSRDEWLELISTHSDHIVLPPARREALLARVAATIDALGGDLDVEYRTTVLTAIRA